MKPGWYKDPTEPTTQRYWDGEGWVGDPLPIEATPPPGPPPPSAPPAAAPEGPTAADTTGGTTAGGANTGGAQAPEAPGPEVRAPQTPAPQRGPQPAGPPPPPPGTGAPWPPAGAPWPPAGAPWPPPGVPVPPGAQPPPGYPIHPAYARLFAPAPRPHGYPIADIGRRLVARLVDIAVLILINAVVNGWFIYQFWREFWPYYRAVLQRAQEHLPYQDVPQPQNISSLTFTITAIAAALWFAYEVPAVANSGQTLGKRLLGLKVLRLEADGPLGFGRSWRRWNPMGVATLLWTCCGIGFVFQFIDCLFVAINQPLHQALHDKSAATVVVDVKHEKSGGPQ
ncbi:RDD family protein [Planosporangium thailandense]|uniref:RDD family protein n=1 Tax=Planosporangium thailandense TaxID=765197 RepID=A0ABX0Y8Z4_9ACTN|nr:RDD family protein [Planosporangium thailandense]